MIKSKNIRKIVVYGRGMADTISFRCFVYQGFGDVDFSFYDISSAQSPSSKEATRLALNYLKVFTDEYIGADDSRVVSFYRTARKAVSYLCLRILQVKTPKNRVELDFYPRI